MDANPAVLLLGLRTRLRALRTEHDQAAARFRANQAVGDVLIGIGSQWVEETFDLPSSDARRAATRLRARWRESPEYQQLERSFVLLEDEVRSTVHTVLKRPPSLSRVRQASLLPTKIARLDMVIGDAIERLEHPGPARLARRGSRQSTPRTPNRPAPQPNVWEILSAIGSIASLFGFIFLLATEPSPGAVEASLLGTAVVLGSLAATLYVRSRR